MCSAIYRLDACSLLPPISSVEQVLGRRSPAEPNTSTLALPVRGKVPQS